MVTWVSVTSLVIAFVSLIYSLVSNTKRYELTYQYYKDVLDWHNRTVEVLTYLKLNHSDKNAKNIYLAKLSALIETGRFYFPNLKRDDGHGEEKPSAYKGYRNAVLSFLVYEYQIFQREDCAEYLLHAESLQRLFTSYVFQHLDPIKHNNKIKHNTNIQMKDQITFKEFLEKSPESLAEYLDENGNFDL